MGGMLNILATLLSVVVAIPGKVSNRACQLSSFSANEVEWNLPCFRVSENSGQPTQYVLNFLDLSTPLSTPTEEQKQIIISMADEIMELHYIESVYYFFSRFLVWLKNVQIAAENYKTGSTDLCRWFIRHSFQMTLQDAGYKGLLQLRSESISFNETRLQRFFQDLPIAVLTHYMNDLEYHHKPTFSELEGILSKQIQNSFDSLKSDENHGIITNISEQISSDLLSVLSAALSNINSLVVSGDITFLVETERWATGKYVEACTENAVEWETKILQSLQNLTNALHTSSSDILNLMLSLLHQSDSTSEGDDPQFYLKSTPSEGVNSTQNYNKASAKTHSATNQDDGKTKAMANNDEGNYEKQKTTITSSENARTTHTIPAQTENTGNKDGVTYDNNSNTKKETTTITSDSAGTTNVIPGPLPPLVVLAQYIHFIITPQILPKLNSTPQSESEQPAYVTNVSRIPVSQNSEIPVFIIFMLHGATVRDTVKDSWRPSRKVCCISHYDVC
ncbi:hypothetical protein HOLleu_43613 [Holothuria leucospilota]|uniref:Uncharacterized protein n=1 Tax=Holothuria leucospilota TaxID=206669 RepID=A0A9Q0YAI6_HOLLE|nr:hypothetical protein HOLleu_43613 [Holothuria leucospilota]